MKSAHTVSRPLHSAVFEVPPQVPLAWQVPLQPRALPLQPVPKFCPTPASQRPVPLSQETLRQVVSLALHSLVLEAPPQVPLLWQVAEQPTMGSPPLGSHPSPTLAAVVSQRPVAAVHDLVLQKSSAAQVTGDPASHTPAWQVAVHKSPAPPQAVSSATGSHESPATLSAVQGGHSQVPPLPHTERVALEQLSLPMFAELLPEQVEHVSRAVAAVAGNLQRV